MSELMPAEGHRQRMSLRARVAILTAAAVAIAILLATIGVYLTVREQLYDSFDQDLLGRARAAVGGSLSNPETIVNVPPEAFGGAQAALIRPDGIYYPGESPPLSAAEMQVAAGQRSQSIRSVSQGSDTLRVVAVPVSTGSALVLAQSTDSVKDTLREVGLVSLIIGLLGVLAAASAGYVVARTGLAPLASLTAAAEHVAATTDLTPITEPRSDDEVGRLTRSFNAMLTSLSTARERERQLVADAGHELRTPLTSLRTNLDLLSQSEATHRPLSGKDRSELLTDVREQVRELGVLVDDLMQLSRGPEPLQMTNLDMAHVVRDAIARVQRRSQNVRFEVRLAPSDVTGDPVLLERAVTNLLDNAIKWSPPDAEVRVTLERCVLTVEDSGPGIAPEDREKVFERFYRSGEARGTPGSGLGLAIVAQVVEQHGGTIDVDRSDLGGARIVVVLPPAFLVKPQPLLRHI